MDWPVDAKRIAHGLAVGFPVPTLAGLDRPPDAVGSWRSAGIEAAEALHCREMGYDLAAARELKRRGLTPQEAYRQGLRRQAGGLGARPSSPEEEAYQRFQAAGVQPALVGEYLMAEWTDDEALSWARHRYRARRRSSRRSWGSPRPRRNRCAGAASGRWWWSAGSLSTRRPRCGRCAATMTGRPTEAAVPRKAVR